MIVVIKVNSPEIEIDRVIQELSSFNTIAEKIIGKQRVAISLIGDTSALDPRQIQIISPFIEKVLQINPVVSDWGKSLILRWLKYRDLAF
jgi:3-deoxy-7-phosphoheptulonate synthase